MKTINYAEIASKTKNLQRLKVYLESNFEPVTLAIPLLLHAAEVQKWPSSVEKVHVAMPTPMIPIRFNQATLGL